LGTIAYLLGFLPVFITVAVLSKAGLGPPFGVLALLAVGALTFLVARQATIAAGRRRRRLLRDVFDRLESRLESNDTDLRTNLAATGLRAVPGVETRSQSNSPGDPGAGVP
jgi:hypothetical protein